MLRKHEREKNIKSKGFFIEAGAGDGEVISNSLYFELKYEVKLLVILSVKSQLFMHIILFQCSMILNLITRTTTLI
jgi:hypothetical protein